MIFDPHPLIVVTVVCAGENMQERPEAEGRQFYGLQPIDKEAAH